MGQPGSCLTQVLEVTGLGGEQLGPGMFLDQPEAAAPGDGQSGQDERPAAVARPYDQVAARRMRSARWRSRTSTAVKVPWRSYVSPAEAPAG